MSVLDAVRNLNNQTEWQRSADRARQVEESAERGRNVGGTMGKNDFLMLLSAQLRHQDPLNPSSDSEFASQLAQFSSLEQMQNMNSSLESMASMQSYSLVGKFVIAEMVVNGQVTELAGEVDSIFVRDGVTFAQIGENAVPISAIREVFNTSNILTSDRLMQTSNSLVGREVLASVDGTDVVGIVMGIVVDRGTMYAQLDTGRGEPQFVPVNTIVEIRHHASEMPRGQKPERPPNAINFRVDPNGGFFELSEDGANIIGRWDWNETQWRWVFSDVSNTPAPPPTPPVDDDEPEKGDTPPVEGTPPGDGPGDDDYENAA